jgi:hypothetical protein
MLKFLFQRLRTGADTSFALFVPPPRHLNKVLEAETASVIMCKEERLLMGWAG